MQQATEELQVDLDQARQFIELLTGSPTTQVTFQTFPDVAKGGSADIGKYRARDALRRRFGLKKVFDGTLSQYAARLTKLNEQGAGVFVTVNETNLKGRKGNNIVSIRAVFADFDDADAMPLERAKTLDPAPHIVVESSAGKGHVYWKVTDCPLAEFTGMQKQLAVALHSDKSVNDNPRVMRLPGFFHQKGEPFRTRIVDTSDTPSYTLAEIKKGLLTSPETAPKAAAPSSARAESSKRTQRPPDVELEKICSALNAIPASEWDYRDTWLTLGMALHDHGTRADKAEACFDLWCTHARVSKKFDPGDSRRTWDSFSAKEDGISIATLYKMAQGHGWQISRMARGEPYSNKSDGVYYHGVNKNGDPLPPLRICGPLKITAEATDERSGAWGLVLEFTDRAGKPKIWVMPIGMLAGEAVDVRAELMTRGLWLAPGKVAREHLSHYLHSAENLPRATYTDRPGWCAHVYVTTDKTIGGGDSQRVLYQGGALSHLSQRGKVADWRDNVASLAVGNSRLVFAISAAFAAPLLYMAGVDSGGFHFGGDSSQGKTSIVRAAASVWGGKDYTQTWRATSNGLEGVAQQHNDGLLVLDEMGQVEPKEAGEAAYMLANGRGKARAGRTGAARPIAQWRLLYLSTGELGLAVHMNKAGHRVEAGQEIRLIEIPADSEKGLGIYDTLNGRADGAGLSTELVKAASEYHGAAGLELLTYLTSDYTARAAEVAALHTDYKARLLPVGAEGQVKRAVSRFALIAAAGQIATQQGLTGWEDGEALEAARICLKAWLKSRGGPENAERRGILHQVRAFLEAHGASRFQSWTAHDSDRMVLNRAGFRDQDDDGVTFYVFTEAFKNEICKGKDSRAVAKLLVKEGWIRPGKDGKTSRAEALPGMGTKRCYVFFPRAMQAEIA